MLQKIKDALNAKELVESLSKEIQENTNQVNALNAKVSELGSSMESAAKQITEYSQAQKRASEAFSECLQGVEDSSGEFEKQIMDFKLQKTNMQRRLLEKADGELKEHLDRIKADVLSYNNLKKDIESINATLQGLRKEIDKFTAIASSLKEKDFTLASYEKKLTQSDHEKLRLMKEIDAMQKLVSRMRRKS